MGFKKSNIHLVLVSDYFEKCWKSLFINELQQKRLLYFAVAVFVIFSPDLVIFIWDGDWKKQSEKNFIFEKNQLWLTLE